MLDLSDYPAVMQRLRDKVIKEVDRAGTREKFCEHLSKRFNLIEESGIGIVPPPEADQGRFKGWNLDKLIEIFEQRHSIVHRCALPVTDSDYLAKVSQFFSAIQTTLTANAIDQYEIDLDPPVSLFLVGVLGKLYGVSESLLAPILFTL